MSVFMGDFLGFQLGDEHSYGLNITRVTTGDRYTDILLPSFTDQTADVPGGDGTYYWDTYYTSKIITIDFAFDDLRDEDLRKLRQMLSRRTVQPLILDEFPYKKYLVKCSAPPQIKYVPFDNMEFRVYKGEGSVSFIAYYPFAFGTASPSIEYNENGGEINNLGDMPANLAITYPMSNIIPTVSGAFASFTVDHNVPLKSLSAAINPVQNLNGYDYPWATGGRANKLTYPYSDTHGSSMTANNVTYTVNSDGSVKIVTSAATSGNTDYYFVGTNTSTYQDAHLTSGTYIVSLSANGSYTGAIRFYVVEEGQNILGSALVGSPTTVTIDSTKTYRLFLRTASGATANATFYPMIRPSTVSDETWMPYSNICPITGWTSMNFFYTGKNIARPDASDSTAAGVEYTKNPDGSITGYGRCTNASTTKTYSNKFYLPVGVDFILSGTGTNINLRINTQNAAGTVVRRIPDRGSGVTFALREGEVSASVQIFGTANADVDETIYPMVRLASNDSSEWEQYNGSKITIDFSNEIDTVYSGTLDIFTGILTVDKVSITIDSPTNIYANNDKQYYIPQSITGAIIPAMDSAELLCDRMKSASGEYYDNRCFIDSSGAICWNTSVEYTDIEAMLAGIGGSLQFVYPLETPFTVQLTASQLSALLGENNVWANTGNVSLTYGQDVTLSLEQPQGTTVGQLALSNISKIGNNDKYFCIDTRTQLIEGLDGNYNKTGNLYNKFITSGDFFFPDVGRSYLKSNIEFEKAEFTPLYY